MFLLTYLLT